ncbi:MULTISPECIES: nitrous oxide reductase accessory protein NosL [Rummeliibacillus]|uniref:nitrous oxide reductase accessory protein NosL n=1 Tax=Rummeliibacillus TaxID=648802 RepID=UPI0011B3E991|nr:MULTISPECIES: nitrous oxide reductase accessory protein NosL [Rummeliibacillus]
MPKDTDCAFCNMVVYQQNVPLGVFSAQAIKKNGKVVYYDDISCLLYDEVKNRETNKKYVRDYKTLNWIQTEKATYVKTSLVSPMDDGYIYFAKADEAKNYIAKHSGAKIVPFQTIQKESIQKYQ